MVADVLTVLSFSVLIVNKVIPVISQNVGCVLSIKELLLLQGERQQHFLVFFIKICFVSIGAEYQTFGPRRRAGHLVADCGEVYVLAAFDDQLIMNVTDNEAVPERFYSVTEDVAADSLDDVFHELRTVGFDAFPFLCGSNAFVGDGFSAILVFFDTGLHVGKQSA